MDRDRAGHGLLASIQTQKQKKKDRQARKRVDEGKTLVITLGVHH